jgi:uncharacterized membrane protein
MSTSRLEAFSDAVIAIIMTIMVLELAVPHEPTRAELLDLWPAFFAYALSFVNLGIYWNNHHHMLAVTTRINGRILWANLHLLFWLSLFPFMTAWMGETNFDPLPTAGYGVVSLCAAIGYYILMRAILAEEGKDSTLAVAVGRDLKGRISPVLYLLGILLAPVLTEVSLALYVIVALIWFLPDRRIESRIEH